MGSYADNVTVNRYNGHITDINLRARPSDIYECTLAMLCIKLCKLNQAAKRLFVTGTRMTENVRLSVCSPDHPKTEDLRPLGAATPAQVASYSKSVN